MVVRRVLAETTVGADERVALTGEQIPPVIVGPMRRTAETRPEPGRGLESDQFRNAVVVLLRQCVTQMVADAFSGRDSEACGERKTGVGRRRVITEGLQGERDGDQTKGSFLPAHPVRAAVGRIASHPILERRPEEFDVTVVAVAQPGTDEGVGPGEAGELPDALDIVGGGIP